VPLNNGWLIRKIQLPDMDKQLDLIIFEKQEDLDIVGKVIADLKQCPKYLLIDKPLRVQLFEKGVHHYGFVNNNVLF
jgi:hypothetical protein